MANTDYVDPLDGSAPANTTVKTALQGNVNIVRSTHNGDSTPNVLVAGMQWVQPSTGVVWLRNAANSAWIPIGSYTPRSLVQARLSVSATGTTLLMTHKSSFVVEKLRLTSATTTTSDGSNLWTWQLRNATDAVNLFATAPHTNGADLTAHVVLELVPDQNLTVGADDVLRFDFTKTGSATSIAELLVEVTGYVRGA